MFRNLLFAFAAMCLTMTASAQVTVTPAKVVVEKTAYLCRGGSDCRVRLGLANHYKSYTCVGYVKTPYKAGKCEFEKLVCDDGDSNTLDGFTASTDPAQACIHTPPTCKLDSECEDGDGCTVDYCSYAGICSHYDRWNCTPCDTDDQCETQVQTQCSYASEMSWTEGCMPDGYCDRVWTETQFCPNGCDDAAFMCLADADVDCQDGNPCTLDTFNTTTKECENIPTNEGLACQDGLNCTFNEVCQLGVCVAQNNYDAYCADNNPCTTDSCDEATYMCTHKQKSCDDGNACTNDSCNGATGACVNSTKNCSDGALCTVDTCLASTGACESTAKNCDDGNTCTTDSCDSVTGNCVNVGKTCNDNNACTTDSCDASGVCVNTVKTCNDQNPCTTDSCNSAGGCVNTANTLACNDGSVCTSNDVCANKVCGGTAVVCNDNNACTTDSCNPASGCVFTTISGCVPVSGKQANLVNLTASSQEILVACDGTNPNFTTVKKSVVIGAGATFTFSGGMGFCWAEIVLSSGPSWNDLGTYEVRLAKWQTIFKITDGSGQDIAPAKTASGYDVGFATK